MEVQYSFITNSNGNDKYSVVMSAWYIDQETGNRVELGSSVKSELTLKDAFIAQSEFMDKDYRVEDKSELKTEE